ncbi:MAG: hypothetical protein LKE43_04245 [Olsenella sp.]|nr:hypothetical protein [Olsenella sp.]MCH3956183.1 hypothetical protein [Olsenella sp.]
MAGKGVAGREGRREARRTSPGEKVAAVRSAPPARPPAAKRHHALVPG